MALLSWHCLDPAMALVLPRKRQMVYILFARLCILRVLHICLFRGLSWQSPRTGFHGTAMAFHGISSRCSTTPMPPPLHGNALSRHCKDARIYGHATTAMYDVSTPPLPAPQPPQRRPSARTPETLYCSCIRPEELLRFPPASLAQIIETKEVPDSHWDRVSSATSAVQRFVRHTPTPRTSRQVPPLTTCPVTPRLTTLCLFNFPSDLPLNLKNTRSHSWASLFAKD